MDKNMAPGGVGDGLSRRSFAHRSLALGGLALAGSGLSGVLGACGDDDGADSGAGAGITADDVAKAKGTIAVYGWSSERAPEQNAGAVKAKWTDIGGDAAQIPIKIKPPGAFDVFTSNAGQMEQYFATGRMAPIDTSLLTNYKNLDKALRNDSVWKGPDGKVYAVPIVLGPAMMGWKSNEVPEPTSVQDLLKPEYKNAIGLYDDYQMINTVAQGLGFPQPPALTHGHLDQIKAYLEKLAPQVKTFFTFGGEAQLFGRGDITVAYTTFASLVLGESSDPTIQTNYVSSVCYGDALSMLQGGDEAASLAWIDQAISAEGMKGLARVAQAPTAMQAANRDLPPELAQLELLDLVKKAPIVGPYPLEADGDAVTAEEATSTWTEYKASFG